jgi:hypothetical protein
MMNEDIRRIRDMAVTRAARLEEEEAGLRRRLLGVRTAGWPLLVISIVCPVAAGASALWKPWGESAAWIIAVFSFAGAAAAALHKALGCDSYQANCCRTLQSLRSLAEDFQALDTWDDADLKRAFDELETRRRVLRAKIDDLPPKRRRTEFSAERPRA